MILRRAVSAASLVLAVAAASAPAAGALTTGVAPGRACDGVTVVVEQGDLGGPDLVRCATEGGTAAELLAEVGVELEFQPGMQDFVCTVDGRPQDRDCTGSDAYWSLWWSDGSLDWAYATLGVSSLEVGAGGSVAFAWHHGDGRAEPPSHEVDASTSATAAEPAAEPAADRPADDEGSSFPTWVAVGIAVLVIGAAAAVPLLRRRAG